MSTGPVGQAGEQQHQRGGVRVLGDLFDRDRQAEDAGARPAVLLRHAPARAARRRGTGRRGPAGTRRSRRSRGRVARSSPAPVCGRWPATRRARARARSSWGFDLRCSITGQGTVLSDGPHRRICAQLSIDRVKPTGRYSTARDDREIFIPDQRSPGFLGVVSTFPAWRTWCAGSWSAACTHRCGGARDGLVRRRVRRAVPRRVPGRVPAAGRSRGRGRRRAGGARPGVGALVAARRRRAGTGAVGRAGARRTSRSTAGAAAAPRPPRTATVVPVAGGDPPTERVDLHRALAGLPRRQREVVVLRYVADLSEADVAAALGLLGRHREDARVARPRGPACRARYPCRRSPRQGEEA